MTPLLFWLLINSLALTFLFPAIDCDNEHITNTSQPGNLDIEFEDMVCVVTLHNSALWNINSKGGYWHYSNDIKTYLTIDSKGKLKVGVWSP